MLQYLDKIGQVFFGLPPKPSNRGMMEGILGVPSFCFLPFLVIVIKEVPSVYLVKCNIRCFFNYLYFVRVPFN